MPVCHGLECVRIALWVHENDLSLERECWMNGDKPSGNSLLERMRQSVRRAQRLPQLVQPRDELEEARMRQSVRTLAQSRISHALRQLRASHGLSYEDVHAQTGISPQRLWDVEYGDKRMTLAELRTVVSCFGLEVEDLLGIDLEANSVDGPADSPDESTESDATESDR